MQQARRGRLADAIGVGIPFNELNRVLDRQPPLLDILIQKPPAAPRKAGPGSPSAPPRCH